MTQCETILAMLRMGPLCSYTFYKDSNGLTHRLAARIVDLKHQGHEITSRPCQLHRHESRAVVYELAGVDQLSLAL